MSRIAFVFPGQGAQYRGMAREFYETFAGCRQMFEHASETAGFSMEKLIFEDEDRLNVTSFTQPALVTASCAVLHAVKEAGIRADMTAGLSLGEYCALTAAGALTFADAVRVVCERGRYMSEEVPSGSGAMTAIMSRKPVDMEEICDRVSRETGFVVTVANYNCPGQRVISGERTAVELAAKRILEAGAARAVPLKVDGPFHSQMLKGAGEKLADYLEQTELKAPEIPFISNVTAQEEKKPERIKELLGQQVCSSVRWEQSMEYMIRQEVDTFVEIGPGNTLSNFAKKIDRSLKVFSVETVADLENLKEALKK